MCGELIRQYHAGNAQSEYLRWWSGPDLRITPQIIIVDAG